ncbi:hypothetical protein FOL47_000784 [Perkinsus chesapeaki]|uniref:SWIM-type domain-containing protein n=1 Tax=Perkinsus chesapeaki TaxID=330153 RepID=A0A7J6MMM2_PERCH|nr:hypothetical protein FOL47_000784 [Perkinsus chesapeaki]
MLHDTIIEAIDKTLRFIRGQDELFGGCCTIFGGDCLQLRGPEPAKHGEFAERTVRPVWESSLWRDMNLQVYYLTRFHRGILGGSTATRPGRRGRRKPLFSGNGVDEDYLNLLAELRSWRPDSDWNISKRSQELVHHLVDKEGPHEPSWCAITLFRDNCRAINDEHLMINPGELIKFHADVFDDTTGDEDLHKLTIKKSIGLKIGCRVICNTNVEPYILNGDMGRVSGFVGLTRGQNEVHIKLKQSDSLQNVAVRVSLDRNCEEVDVYPVTQEVFSSEGKLLYALRNVPLDLGAAITCHKLQGCTLDYAVVDLSLRGGPNAPKAAHAEIERLLSQPWLHGALYTMLSRVGSSSRIFTKFVGDLAFHKKVFFSTSALAFEDWCKRSNVLTRSALPGTPPYRRPVAQEDDDDNISASVDSWLDGQPNRSESAGDHRVITPEELSSILKERDDRLIESFGGMVANLLVNFSRTGLLGSAGTCPVPQASLSNVDVATCHNDSFFRMAQTNLPSFHSLMMNNPVDSIPSIDRMKARAMADDNQGYQGSDETVERSQETVPCEARNRSSGNDNDDLHDDTVDREIDGLDLNEEPDSTEAGQPDNEERFAQSPSSNEDEPGSSISESSGIQSSDTEGDEINSTSDSASIMSTGANHSSSTQRSRAPKGPGGKWMEEAFHAVNGPIEEVIKEYLAGRPFLTQVKSVHENRKRRELRCLRRLPPGEPVTGNNAKPSWRLWPSDACQFSCILVVESGPPGELLCSFYGVCSAGSSIDAWKAHDHPYDSHLCRSVTVPPPLVDLAARAISKDPTLTAGDIKELWNAKRDRGLLGSRERAWLDLKEDMPGYPDVKGNIRNVVTSITRRRLYGLKLEPFLEKVQRDIGENLADLNVSDIIDAIKRTGSEDASGVDEHLRDKSNICLMTPNPTLKVDEEGNLLEMAIGFTSPRMVHNYLTSDELAADVTFNLIAAECSVFTMTSINAAGAARPILVGLVRSENRRSIEDLLKSFHELIKDAGIRELPRITRTIQDGSKALHGALSTSFEQASTSCCYFHFMQAAKRKKPPGIRAGLWSALKSDLRTISKASSQSEFTSLVELLFRKWNEKGETKAIAFLEAMASGEWFDGGSFRSRWAACHNDGVGGRTSNGIEVFHRFLKKTLLRSRRMRTLLQFAYALAGDEWRSVSAYNKHRVDGRIVHQSDRVSALTTVSFSPLPRTLPPSVRGPCQRASCRRDVCCKASHYFGVGQHVYVFRGDKPSRVSDSRIGVADDKLCLRVTQSYDNFEVAKRIMDTISLVTFTTTAAVTRLPRDGGPRCTCESYAARSKCPHVVALGRHFGVDDQVAWQRAEAKLQRKLSKGVAGPGLRLNETTRYGGTRQSQAQALRATQSSIRARGLDCFDCLRILSLYQLSYLRLRKKNYQRAVEAILTHPQYTAQRRNAPPLGGGILTALKLGVWQRVTHCLIWRIAESLGTVRDVDLPVKIRERGEGMNYVPAQSPRPRIFHSELFGSIFAVFWGLLHQ